MRSAIHATVLLISLGSPAFAGDTSTADLIAACDKAAASPQDKTVPAGIVAVAPEKIEAASAIPACEAAARAAPGNARVLFELGRAYRAGKNYDAARIRYEEAMRAGSALAASNLGSLYAEGLGSLPRDDREAARLFRIAADQGVAAAQSNLGSFYQNGRGGLPKDDVEAVRLYRLAAGQGYAAAQNALGNFFHNGRGGLPRDDVEAARLYKLAADQEFPSAQTNLGYFYQEGRGGLPKDDGAAARLYKLAADHGNAFGQHGLAYFYQVGRGGLPKDDVEAARLYRLAADQGNASSQNSLGTFYQAGRGGLPRDDVEAARLYKLAAGKGNAYAQNNLAYFYQEGRGGLPKDDAEAVRLYKLAVEQNNAAAQSNLGYFHATGRGGMPKDDTEAVRLYRLSAAQGSALGQVNLGNFYQQGRGGLPKDDAEAARYYKLAADQSNAVAQCNLGILYANGRGGLVDDDREAARLYKLSAAQGNACGHYNIGLYYEYGRGGVAKDDAAAAREYKLAVERGHADAQTALNRVSKRLSAAAVVTLPSASSQPVVIQDNGNAVVLTPSGRRVALVIGNSAYKSAPFLPNPVRDATTVADALRKIGFQTVNLVKDAGRDKMVEALRSFAKEADNSDWALIYYAGHGIEMGGVNYLIPVDARLVSDRDVQFEAIGLDQLMSATEGARKLRIMLLDACRDNPFLNQIKRSTATRSMGRGLAQVEPDAGMLVVYAAKHGQVALDGEGGANSPFVSALIKRIATPQIEIRKLFDLVRDDVMAATGRQQQPFSYGSVPGSEDFYFLTRKTSQR